MENTPPNKRACLRGPIIVTQVKMGDERKYFFGYAKDISRAGIFVNTLTPKKVGEEFNLEFTVPKSDIIVKCRCRVVWNRRLSEAGSKEPGMGIMFLDLDPEVAERIDRWVITELKYQEKK